MIHLHVGEFFYQFTTTRYITKFYITKQTKSLWFPCVTECGHCPVVIVAPKLVQQMSIHI